MSNKLGFWPVFALVTGSQIGSGIFTLPVSLAPYGVYSLIGWLVAAVGAISLAFVFGNLCSRFPYTGGPHIYVDNVFGPHLAFFVGWIYWVISWVSTSAVVVASIGYLTPIIGEHSNLTYLILEIILLLSIASINLKGLKLAGHVESFLTILKFIPLIIIPICALSFFDFNNFIIADTVEELPLSKILGKVILITFWGFIGVESATTPAGSVENAAKVIPRAIILGTILVAVVYFINTAAVMGLINGTILATSNAPYVDVTRLIFSGNWHLLIALVTSIVCIGTLNAWILASSQIAVGLSDSGFMPKSCAIKNKNGAPSWALIISAGGIIPILIALSNQSMFSQINLIIDFSVIAFLFIYLICSLALLKLIIKDHKINYTLLIVNLISIIFCGFVIYQTISIKILIGLSYFVLSSLPAYIYIFWSFAKKNKK